jgi:hypothetical protein
LMPDTIIIEDASASSAPSQPGQCIFLCLRVDNFF